MSHARIDYTRPTFCRKSRWASRECFRAFSNTSCCFLNAFARACRRSWLNTDAEIVAKRMHLLVGVKLRSVRTLGARPVAVGRCQEVHALLVVRPLARRAPEQVGRVSTDVAPLAVLLPPRHVEQQLNSEIPMLCENLAG